MSSNWRERAVSNSTESQVLECLPLFQLSFNIILLNQSYWYVGTVIAKIITFRSLFLVQRYLQYAVFSDLFFLARTSFFPRGVSRSVGKTRESLAKHINSCLAVCQKYTLGELHFMQNILRLNNILPEWNAFLLYLNVLLVAVFKRNVFWFLMTMPF